MDNTSKAILTKRFQTTMIGALFEFEKAFGYLWGQFKPDNEQLTAQEEHFQEKWDEVRNQILNNGNSQLRKALSDLDKLNTQAPKYHYKFYKKGNGNEN